MTTATADDGAPDSRREITARILANARTTQPNPALAGFSEHLRRMLEPTSNRIAERLLADAMPNFNEQIDALLQNAMAPVQEQMNSLIRNALQPVRADWSEHIAGILNTATTGTRPRQDLLAILDQFDEIARNNPDLDDLVADDADADLGEIGEEGLAFVNAEGAGLSWEMRRRLFQAFVLLTVFSALMTVVVSSETVSGILEDAAVPSTVATAVLLAANRKWDEKFPRPDGDGEEGPNGE
ncbi:hypothetical protein PV677_36460 [Streptomyces sp. DE06-01C]|uniref:hypothetical protein n=1 Tax=Streptomyces sp. DE06-01C TaxID=3028656 RepID=UPI0029C4A35A|nr:hypothetical protein [Streptomyces sp. DE06-01C]MDX5526165.1 hypothetical protein [Streptomyces sp. DE06-01C]